MARTMTVVTILEPVLNENGEVLDKDGDPVGTSKKKHQEPAFEDVYYYLLHWGLTYEILMDKEQRYPVSYTVGICQNIKTGVIKTFIPQEITVVGKEVK